MVHVNRKHWLLIMKQIITALSLSSFPMGYLLGMDPYINGIVLVITMQG